VRLLLAQVTEVTLPSLVTPMLYGPQLNIPLSHKQGKSSNQYASPRSVLQTVSKPGLVVFVCVVEMPLDAGLMLHVSCCRVS